MGVPIYCPICCSYHEQTGCPAGCPQPTTEFYPNEYYGNPTVNPIESKLDEIIRLLKQLLEKNNK